MDYDDDRTTEQQWDDDDTSSSSPEEASDSDSSSSSGGDTDEESASESDDYDTPDSVVVYSKHQLWSTTSSRERAYLRSRPGICAGLSLAWLQLVVCDDVQPGNCWPEVSFARQLQEYIEHNSVRHQYFPEVAYMADEGRSVFDDVDDGLRYVWYNPGSYILLIRPRYARIGHAVAYSDRYSYPRGYLMNPNKGAHCCYTYRGLADEFRSDRFIWRAENSSFGPEFIVIRIGKPASSEQVQWHAREDAATHNDDENDGEYIQYGV